ncbi:phosphonate metabolism protein PhnM [Nitratireductor aestuarii]|uniref:Phosphonate metabolism protein PhnM n=1 Tax=Nitratireductor aestuarii TaxID=1735103 RepID=A0A916W0K9_9HYPH|nr:alpha-D-ribose 1-methylphosphonate 5-triphosphate diphosphatase [Nitratireductor aestuarii]GGA58049.1 phosphonate metabolism protein PhnM [Nitratireductor aestuarii]
MAGELVLSNARIVLPDEVVLGSVVVRDGRIAEVSEGVARTGEDMNGDFIIPGLVELHTDHIETHYAPRPGVRWNPKAAVQAHDAQIAASGITTVFDALRCGMDDFADLTGDDMGKLADAIVQSSAAGTLRAEHFIHLRCEVSAPDCLDTFEAFRELPAIRMASLMDHAPGQRQFSSLEKYAEYYQKKLNLNDVEFRRFCAERVRQSEENSRSNRRAIAAASSGRNIVLASHDDATLAHVEEAIGDGVSVAEFPTTIEAALASREAGMAVLMGAPNLVRGGSHSGNVSARELAERGCLDILSSDYIPFSLLQAGFLVSELIDGVSLPQGIAMVTRNPARAAGLTDRGAIEAGMRADLVRVELGNGIPVVRCVYREGVRVA